MGSFFNDVYLYENVASTTAPTTQQIDNSYTAEVD